MKRNGKKGLIALMGGLGFIALIVAIFTELLSFTDGLVIAIILWVLAGVLKQFLGVEK